MFGGNPLLPERLAIRVEAARAMLASRDRVGKAKQERR